MSKYKSALGRIHATEEFKSETIEMLVNASEDSSHGRIKPLMLSALAACLALFIGLGFVLKNYGVNLLGTPENSFVLTVNAAEVSENSGAVNLDINYYALRASVKDNYYSYEIRFPAKYTGENIDTISYSVNRGGFTLGDDFDPTVIKKGVELEHRYITEKSDNVKAYSSFTIDYESQGDTPVIGLVGDNVHLDGATQKYLKYYGNYLWGTNETVLDALMGDIVVTSKITFKDGTHKIQKIQVGTKVMKYCDAYPDKEFHKNKSENLFITFNQIK